VTPAPCLGMLRPVTLPRLIALSTLCLATISGGCTGGTETGNPPFKAELSYTAYSSDPTRVGVRAPSTQLVVDNAWLDLDGVALLGTGSCADTTPATLSLPALGIGDHAAGQHNATVFRVASGDYCALEVPFVLAPQSEVGEGAPPDLARHSIMLAGALSDGTPFTLLSASTPRVRLLADAGSFEISAQSSRTLIAFDLAAWLADLNWEQAARVDGVIHISTDENAALLAQFEGQLARGIALYRDEDGDGQLDAQPERLAHGE